MAPYEKRAAENRRSNAALLRLEVHPSPCDGDRWKMPSYMSMNNDISEKQTKIIH